jgi:meso-butanediol dehydrogenase / (S,S)-butanediol dehydrogenase / diacetyl reductase
MEFQGKVVVVTGGGSGIGEAAVRAFADRHAAVAVVDRNAEVGGKIASELKQKGIKVKFSSADVSSGSQVEQLIAQIVSEFGGIDVLVNCAGIQRYGTVTSLSEAQWDEVLNVNLKSAFLMCKFAIPEMIKRGGGAIVIVGSAQSVAALRNSAHYIVSKHGLLGLARSVALDYGGQGIRANCVLPGAIDTPMLRWSASLDPNPEEVLKSCDRMHIRGKMGRPEEVANVIVFLASDLASFVTGSAVMVDGGLLVPIGGMSFTESGTGSTEA